ncbi:MAG: rhomboid family intramembrane serine protease [Candidatus Krumholzibacteriota bacterium]|nr:rhomboid family intramembrane serine protease [Candidatus Krumholzibacteriota bacterium]
MYFFYYFPVGLDLRIKRPPSITYFLSGLCALIFILYHQLPHTYGWRLTLLIFHPDNPSLATSLTHIFLHAGYLHIIGNLIYLVIFGRLVEDRFGAGRFFLIFALSAMAGAWTHTGLTSLWSPQYLRYGVIGASGATSGLLGAFLVRFYFGRIRVAYWIFMPLQGVNRVGRTQVPVILGIAFWFIYQGVYTALQYGIEGVQVAYSVHIGGFACGVLLSLLFGAAPGARSEAHLTKARRYFQQANWFAAQGEYINYLSLRDDDAEVHAETARAFLCSGQTGRARYHFSRAIEGCLAGLERGRAEDIFAAGMKAIPGYTLPGREHLDLAFSLERSMKFLSARQAYQNYISFHPESAETPFVLLRLAGLQERRFNRPREAWSCYRNLVDFYPDDSWADYARAEMDRLRGKFVLLGAQGQ